MRAIAAFERPSAISESTVRSRGVNRSSGSCRRARASSWLTTSGSSTVPPAPTSRTESTNSVKFGHPVLQQVADAADVAADELARVALLDVLRQHQQTDLRPTGTDRERRAHSFVGVSRRHAHVEHDEIRRACARARPGASPRRRSPRAPLRPRRRAAASCLPEAAPSPLRASIAREHRPSTSARRSGWSARARRRATRRGRGDRRARCPVLISAPPTTVVADLDGQRIVDAHQRHGCVRGPASGV